MKNFPSDLNMNFNLKGPLQEIPEPEFGRPDKEWGSGRKAARPVLKEVKTGHGLNAYELEQVFMKYDKNQNKTIDRFELGAILTELGIDPDFIKIDGSCTGNEINFSQFYQICTGERLPRYYVSPYCLVSGEDARAKPPPNTIYNGQRVQYINASPSKNYGQPKTAHAPNMIEKPYVQMELKPQYKPKDHDPPITAHPNDKPNCFKTDKDKEEYVG